ncbi:hypothetical protein HETIRDRAFT_475215 [Heterobasidion irregulare TC 32-1]|uniref:UspA domain-containing protein n=1 Tax=Heterobasidion irregulare (strain TC 32-1) TaxID=747525 RepID=W4K8R5_HETIT|nr:uncharacterized protein HETIRDRAFT_475215 [Heterobasidion irregulare TC 32-1]ETW81740.1 hypothetical protein HETIRDRAFT_475215 [Heterobasidion irregulare TC 32-1]
MSFSSMMGGLTSLSLSRGSTDDKERGRSISSSKAKGDDNQRARSSSTSRAQDADATASARSRSTSPFRLRRHRAARDSSPNIDALTQSDVESDTESSRVRPRSAFIPSALSDDESQGDLDSESGSEDDWSDDQFDPVTERNTERNALVVPADLPDADALEMPDPLGEGVNVVVPPEPYFPSTLNHSGGRNPRRRKSTRHEPLPLNTSRPVFQRDRCTITVTNGDPARALAESGRRSRRYMVGSDMSDESRYALEWAIGTVLRDGDELLIVTVVENESKIDPPVPNAADRAAKLRAQQERQGLAYILCRQATSLLQRTRLHVRISCEAWHAKHARHMLLDIIDFVEPVMLIVGSRGLGQLKGILLGSTSHYLIQKCSVPVMVARRRLKRPPRRSAHLAKHRARVSLAEAAGIERVTPRVDEDVAQMRDEIERADKQEGMRGAEDQGEDDNDPDTEVEGDPPAGTKVAG